MMHVFNKINYKKVVFTLWLSPNPEVVVLVSCSKCNHGEARLLVTANT